MGVKGLFQFLKRFQKEVYFPNYLKNKSVGIDIFWFIHQSKGDLFYFQNSLLSIITNAQKVYCVFDGNPNDEKRHDLETKATTRRELLYSIEQIEKFLKYPFSHVKGEDRYCIIEYLNQLKRQAWQPPPEFIESVKRWLISKNCEVYQAENEADELLVNLEKKGIIDTIITNDSDLLILGSTHIVRPKSPIKGSLYDIKAMSEILGFTAKQWDDFMYLCKNMKENDIVLAYSLISVYKDLEYVLQKYEILHNDNLVENVPSCF